MKTRVTKDWKDGHWQWQVEVWAELFLHANGQSVQKIGRDSRPYIKAGEYAWHIVAENLNEQDAMTLAKARAEQRDLHEVVAEFDVRT